MEMFLPLSTVVLGTILMAAALEGWLPKFGEVPRYSRLPIGISGVLLAFPSWQTDIAGICLLALTMGIYFVTRRLISPAAQRS